MTIQRRFAPISGRFEPERVAGLTGIYTPQAKKVKKLLETLKKTG